MKAHTMFATVKEPRRLVLDDIPFEKGQRLEVLLLAPDHEETDRMKPLKALFKESQALPQMQTITEEEIAAEKGEQACKPAHPIHPCHGLSRGTGAPGSQ